MNSVNQALGKEHRVLHSLTLKGKYHGTSDLLFDWRGRGGGGGGWCLWSNRKGAFCSVCIFHNQRMHVYLIYFRLFNTVDSNQENKISI